jgi:hypothetical protein
MNRANLINVTHSKAIVQYDPLLNFLVYSAQSCHLLHLSDTTTYYITLHSQLFHRHDDENDVGMKQLVTWAATAAAVVLPEPPLPRKVTSFGGGPAPPEQATTMRRLRPLRPVTARVCLAVTTKDGAIPRY